MPAVKKTPIHAVSQQKPTGQEGFLLMSGGILILVIAALLSSFAFVIHRDARYKGNYATGQRIAELTTIAHAYAQQQHYTNGVDLDALNNATPIYSSASPTNPLTPPDNFGIYSVSGVKYVVEVRGQNNCPVNTDVQAGVKAASAYIQIKIRTPAGTTGLPSDRIAFQAGAANRGMDRIGFVDMNLPAGDICDGQPTRVRWGPEASACLNSSHFATLHFTDVQKGDIILPVWETALTRATTDMVYRYKQPERPDTNSMNTNLVMNGNDITGSGQMLTQNLVDTNTATMGNGAASSGMTIRFDSGPNPGALTMNQPATVTNQSMRIYDQNGGPTPLKVTGPEPTTFMPGSNVNIANTLNDTAGSLTVAVANPGGIGVDTVESRPSGTNINITTDVINSPTTVAVKNVLVPVQSVSIPGANGRLAVGAALNTSNLSGGATAMNVYGAEWHNNGGDVQTNPANPWNVGGINQGGPGFPNDNAHYLHTYNVTTNDCQSSEDACPDPAVLPSGGM